FGLSNSFMDVEQTRTSDVDYVIFFKDKPLPDDVEVCKPVVIDGVLCYQPMKDYLSVEPNALTASSSDFAGNNPVYTGPMNDLVVGYGNLNKDQNPFDIWDVILDVPVFEEWYNDTTDPILDPNILTPAQYCVITESFIGDDGEVISGQVPHADLGADLKIQVWGFSYD
ncbi:hypothetical protein ACFLV6_03505, partial [Chloroflexota bacterium]